jgi:hypothetical protein
MASGGEVRERVVTCVGFTFTSDAAVEDDPDVDDPDTDDPDPDEPLADVEPIPVEPGAAVDGGNE